MIINTNISGKNASRILNRNMAEGAKSMKKLASGMRIESAADDAAGLGISEGMRAQIRGLTQASLNAQAGIDLTQTADGAVGEIADALSRLKELAVQAANDTNTKEDRNAIQTEMDKLTKHVDSIAKNTEFNSIKIVDGNLRALDPTSASAKGTQLGSNLISIHDSETAKIVGASRNSDDEFEIHDGKPAMVQLKIKSPIEISTLNPGDQLSFTYNSNPVTLNLTNYMDPIKLVGNPSIVNLTNDELVDCINKGIKNVFGVQKITASFNAPDIVLTSTDRNGSERITMTNSPVLNDIVVAPIAINVRSKSGEDRNDKLTITYSHKLKTSESKFTKEDGESITDAIWTNESFVIDIDHGANRKYKDIMAEIVLENIKFGDINIERQDLNPVGGPNTSKLLLNTLDKGAQARISASSTGNLASVLGIYQTNYGLDKNNTFAIEVNAKYMQVDINLETLTNEDKKQLLNKGIIYTDDGYIIEDPINPQDYIKYTKIKGSGELVEINLDNKDNYSKDELAKEIQDKINAKTIDKNNDVKIMVKDGALVMETDKKLGAYTSLKFIKPSSTDPNTSGEEILKSFLNSSGFDYNRHIGNNGTGKMDIQVGANENQGLRIQIGSLRTGMLGIKYLDVTDNASAQKTLELINKAILKVADEHSGLGAYENVLSHVRANVDNTSENLATSESRIRDCDMAKELVNVSRNNILSQAAQAMMAQAKQQPEGVLQLLK